MQAAAIVGMVSILSACSSWLFYPEKTLVINKDLTSYHIDSLQISMSDGVQLNAWRMPHRKGNLKGAVLFFHGNSGNISKHARQVYWLPDYGYDVVLVDYRGFGLSDGSANLDKNIADIKEVSFWFSRQYEKEFPKYIIAHSLGASMSGYVLAKNKALRQDFDAVVLYAAFSDYREIMRNVLSKVWMLDLLKYPTSLGMPNQYSLIKVVEDISPTPLLIVHGTKDPVVPYQHAVDLHDKAAVPKSFLSFEGNHLNAFDDVSRRQYIVNFLQASSISSSTTQ
jgi:hypothetical protein